MIEKKKDYQESEEKSNIQRRLPVGFRAMLEAVHPTSEKQEPEPQPSNSGFQRMLTASGKGNQPKFPEPEETEKPADHPIVRGYGMGFRAMLDAVTNSIKQEDEDEEPKTVLRDYGFIGMLEAARYGTPEPRIIMRMAHR